MIKKLFLFSLYIYIILVNYLICCNAKISDQRLCADPECSSILSYATTMLRYFPNEKCMLQFPANVVVNVMSKGAGERKDLWEIEYNGKRGYVPSNLLRETKILKKSTELIYVVPTQCGNENKPADVIVEQPKVVEVPIVPASAVESFEMIDGTKVFNDEAVNNTEEVAMDSEKTVETPSLPTPPQPPLENKPSESPSSSLSDQDDDDSDGDDYVEEEEIADDNEDEDVESEETVDSSEPDKVVPDIDVKNNNVESSSESILSENISSEVESENKTEENESASDSNIELNSENVTENVPSPQPEPILSNVEEPSKSEETNTETTPNNMYVTEIPSEIPQPILESQIVLEATTATPFVEPNTENIPQERDPSIPDSNTQPEENSTNTHEVTSETPSVPSVEENIASTENETNNSNESDVVEDEAVASQEEVIKQNVETDQSEKLEPTIIEEQIAEEPPTVNEIPEVLPSQPPTDVYEPSAPPAVPDDPINIDNKLEELGENLIEEKIAEQIVTEPQRSEPIEGDPLAALPPRYIQNNSPKIKISEDADPIPPVLQENTTPLPDEIPVTYLPPSEPTPIEDQPSKESPLAALPPGYFQNNSPKISEDADPIPPVLQENTTPSLPDVTGLETPGLFARIYAKMFGSSNDKDAVIDKQDMPLDEELERILYPEKFKTVPDVPKAENADKIPSDGEPVEGYCESMSPNSCPKSAISSYNSDKHPIVSHYPSGHTDAQENCTSAKRIDLEEYVKIFLDGILKMKDFIIYLTITAATVLSFIFGYYCINKARKETPLINNLNVMERNLMVSKKENALLQGELDDTRQKLASIEDNSFGSNEMVIALKTQLEESENLKIDYQLQVVTLEKELESATEAGLELNRMVAELLNNQSGSESIISSVEELQKQLNEQQETILSINTTLAEKSRENSELQVFLNDQRKQFEDELGVLQSLNDNLTLANSELNQKITEVTETLEVTVNEALKSKTDEIVKLQKELSTVKKRYEDSQRKLAKVESRVQVVDEYLKNAKKDATDAKEVYDLVQLKADALAANKEKEQFRERLEVETDARKLLEDHLKVVSEEVSNLKKEYNVAEKEKVEAQTRLEVLSGYFKDKETQLQKELSIKEAMWLQQQGEKTSTIERVQSMQDEIQTLKSQNDALRAEIEAQAAAHKTQIATLDSRAHEEWLNAKQAKRKLEEVRSEAAGLRRKLTTYGESAADGSVGLVNGIDGNLNAPSPIMMDNNPGASLLGVLPPPPFMPPPFMGPPPPFMPPPFMPGEMRPPPLGRLMSPPPNRYSPNILDDRDRYSPNRSPGRYSPDTRYNYIDVLSPYETETDFSPPPSPPPRHGGYRDNRGYKAYSPPPSQSDNRNKKSKGGLSSGSTDSLPRRRGGGGGGGGDNAGPTNQNGSNKV